MAELVQRAHVLSKAGRLKEAAETAELAVSIDPSNTEIVRK